MMRPFTEVVVGVLELLPEQEVLEVRAYGVVAVEQDQGEVHHKGVPEEHRFLEEVEVVLDQHRTVNFQVAAVRGPLGVPHTQVLQATFE